MKWRTVLNLFLLAVAGLGAALEATAIDTGWMQQGVRVWYFGGVSTGGSSDAEEAYLFKAIAGTSAQVTRHSAQNHWTSPQPADTQTYSLVDQGPIWIHPQVLQNIQAGAEVFFVLAEINYDFAQHVAFAEDDGPHAGFHSWVSEASLGDPPFVGGGAVDIHAQVESRYGPNVEMLVTTTLTGPSIGKPTTYENYAFFGGVPVVKRINHDQAGSVRSTGGILATCSAMSRNSRPPTKRGIVPMSFPTGPFWHGASGWVVAT